MMPVFALYWSNTVWEGQLTAIFRAPRDQNSILTLFTKGRSILLASIGGFASAHTVRSMLFSANPPVPAGHVLGTIDFTAFYG
jgi:hypothetical protein